MADMLTAARPLALHIAHDESDSSRGLDHLVEVAADGGLVGSGLVQTGEGVRTQPRRHGGKDRLLRRAAGPLGIPTGDGYHVLRHFYASLLINSGESVKVVQDRLGHASAQITLDTYSHLWPDSEDKTRAAVDAVLGPGDVSDSCHGVR
jgi:integrase